MPSQSTIAEQPRTKPPLTRNQVRSFWAAWGGWTMDGMDSFIYSLVLVPALADLLPNSGIRATTANVGYYGGLLFALFMVGWGAALIWGPIADRFGRVRTEKVFRGSELQLRHEGPARSAFRSRRFSREY